VSAIIVMLKVKSARTCLLRCLSPTHLQLLLHRARELQQELQLVNGWTSHKNITLWVTWRHPDWSHSSRSNRDMKKCAH